MPVTQQQMPDPVEQFLAQLERFLPDEGLLGVAFSGGVDSTVLTKAAAMVMGADRVLAIIGVSATLAEAELAEARQLAAMIGVELVEVQTKELDNPAFRRNGGDRCFHCRNELFTRIEDELVESLGLSALASGEIVEDLGRTDRPGSAAGELHDVLRPLASAGLTKLQVRAFAHAVGLPNWDKPAAPCLASRIPFNSEVTPMKLQQISQVEGFLRELGFRELRVRHHDRIARIEVPEESMLELVREPWRSKINEATSDAGFDFAVLDLQGLRSGYFARLEVV